MDSTNPDLSRFAARGGKLVILENMADYAQSPYAGIRYFENVQRTLGKEKTAEFARLYTAPGVDHVGSGAPANVDMLGVLVDWVEMARRTETEVTREGRSAGVRDDGGAALGQWPAWTHTNGRGHRAASSPARRGGLRKLPDAMFSRSSWPACPGHPRFSMETKTGCRKSPG